MGSRISWLAIVLGVAAAPSLTAQNPDLILGLTEEVVAPGNQVSAKMELANLAGDIQGWSWGVCHDPQLLSVVDVPWSDVVATINNGNPPDFHVLNVFADGWSVGVVISSHGGLQVLPIGVYDLYYPIYEAGGPTGNSPLEICDTLGSPPVSTCLVISGGCEDPVRLHGEVEVVAEAFVRGDCNQDGNLDLADVIYSELYQFVGGEVPGCLTACDNNDDGILNIADPIYLLSTLFVGGPPLPPPTVSCGEQSTPDSLGCDTFTCP